MIKEEVKRMRELTGFKLEWILEKLSIGRATFYRWLNGKETPKIPFVHPLKVLKEEEDIVVKYAKLNPGIGYKKLTYLMVDENIVYLTPPQVYGILTKYNLLNKWGNVKGKAEKEYREKPTKINEHWHTDIMYVRIGEIWGFLVAILDGFSRYIIRWKLLPDISSKSVSLFIQEVLDKNPGVSPKIIHDNGSQFISKEFREVISMANLIDIRTRRNHPETNGKIERWNGLLRQEALRKDYPITFSEAEKLITKYIDYYNNERLHSSINFLRPIDYYKGNPEKILKEREDKILRAKESRKIKNKEYNLKLKLSLGATD